MIAVLGSSRIFITEFRQRLLLVDNPSQANFVATGRPRKDEWLSQLDVISNHEPSVYHGAVSLPVPTLFMIISAISIV